MPLEKILEKALYYDGAFYLLHLIFCLRLGGAFVFSHFHHRKLFYHNGGAGSIENGVCPPRKMMWFLPNIAQGRQSGVPEKRKLNKLRVGAAIRRPPTTPQSASLTGRIVK